MNNVFKILLRDNQFQFNPDVSKNTMFNRNYPVNSTVSGKYRQEVKKLRSSQFLIDRLLRQDKVHRDKLDEVMSMNILPKNDIYDSFTYKPNS